MAQKPLDGLKVDIPCPQCAQKVGATLRQLKRNPDLTCRAGHVFTVDAKQFTRDLEKVQKQLMNLGKGFGH